VVFGGGGEGIEGWTAGIEGEFGPEGEGLEESGLYWIGHICVGFFLV